MDRTGGIELSGLVSAGATEFPLGTGIGLPLSVPLAVTTPSAGSGTAGRDFDSGDGPSDDAPWALADSASLALTASDSGSCLRNNIAAPRPVAITIKTTRNFVRDFIQDRRTGTGAKLAVQIRYRHAARPAARRKPSPFLTPWTGPRFDGPMVTVVGIIRLRALLRRRLSVSIRWAS